MVAIHAILTSLLPMPLPRAPHEEKIQSGSHKNPQLCRKDVWNTGKEVQHSSYTPVEQWPEVRVEENILPPDHQENAAAGDTRRPETAVNFFSNYTLLPYVMGFHFHNSGILLRNLHCVVLSPLQGWGSCSLQF